MTKGRKRARRQSPSPSRLDLPPEPSNTTSMTEPTETNDQDAGTVITIDEGDINTPSATQSTRKSDQTAHQELTDHEELLCARRIAANSERPAYSYYNTPKLSEQKDKKGRYMIACSAPTNRPTYDSSSGNLLKHSVGCVNKSCKAATNHKLVDLGVGGTGNIDPRSHKNILHPTVIKNLLSSKVVSWSIHMLYTAVQDSYKEVLQAPNGFDILGIVISRLVENNGGQFELEAMSLDFVRLAESHTGKYLAETVRLVVVKFDVQDKICGIVTDNASNNTAMVLEMKKYKWAQFKGEPQWIRCFAHILNLIAQSILKPFGTLKKKKGTGNKDNENNLDLPDKSEEEEEGGAEAQISRYQDGTKISNEDEGTSEDPEEPELLECGEKEAELTLNDIKDLSEEDEENNLYTSAMCKQTLAKFCVIARKLWKSPNSKVEFVELCKELECQRPHSIERDVQTRWNSTWAQIKSIIQCKKAIKTKYSLPRRYHIDAADIELARQLVSILQLFCEQTLQISIRGSAWLSHIIVFIDEITDLLLNVIKGEDNNYPPALRNACQVGLKLTNKYYTLTDCSPLFRIAMGMLLVIDEYFKIAGWENEWMVEALRLTREMFNTFYKPRIGPPSSSQPSKPSRPRTGTIAQLGAAMATQSGQSSTDPLDTWLASSLILDNSAPINALKWWMNQKGRTIADCDFFVPAVPARGTARICSRVPGTGTGFPNQLK
ncbi:hypothetical protein PSTG_14913 [Puccinia striiformis f. sp. tritici PST-78]|uniref:DUF659 domain-containing protein n=1 Tax=Puccinia striiformis f. sp. tritici PST-78 TaxID=1165861 RepID=A0A0L0UY56_9BASI|nr:hypothetical protein PSTG_14913 [Puccinia striiformis f. sp. tritici PST-78]